MGVSCDDLRHFQLTKLFSSFSELYKCFNELAISPEVRCIVLTGSGKHFTAGIDLMDMMATGQKLAALEDVARKGRLFEELIEHHQLSITAIEKCPKPVIAATHSAGEEFSSKFPQFFLIFM